MKDEVIVIGAHLDHIGWRGDVIFPGADDNASGSAALLEVAHAFAMGPRPRRSILFVHFSGEEIGLLGSQLFVKDPLLPKGGKIVAMLNMDMVGRGTGDVSVLVPKLAKSTRLKEFVEPVRRRYLTNVLAKDQIHYGDAGGNSDHQPFVEGGIPALFVISNGEHPDYHKPTDTPEKLQPECMEHVAQFVYALAWEMAALGIPE